MREALAAQLAISLASVLVLDRFILEGDFEVVVLALQHPNCALDWRISPIIFDSLDAILFAFFWEAMKTNRSANFYAYSVTRWAATRSYSASIPFSFTPFLSSPLASGKNPPPSICFL
jgi:hypothetical protein